MTDLVFTPAYQLAQMIRARKVSAVEVLEAHLAQINKHNSMLNAICTRDNVIRIVVHDFNAMPRITSSSPSSKTCCRSSYTFSSWHQLLRSLHCLTWAR